MFKVEIRKTCKICGNEITGKRFRTYCCAKCRNKALNQKNQAYSTQWQRNKRAEIASKPSKRKVKCLVCGGYYVQLGTHVIQAHKFKSAREYREEYDLEVKRGTVPKWYRELKGEQAKENETYKNLEAGKKFRFEKGQEGVGVYHRSHITLKKLSNLYKFNKKQNA